MEQIDKVTTEADQASEGAAEQDQRPDLERRPARAAKVTSYTYLIR